MNKEDFMTCYRVLNRVANKSESEEKTLKRLSLIIQQIEVQDNAQQELAKIREELQKLDK